MTKNLKTCKGKKPGPGTAIRGKELGLCVQLHDGVSVPGSRPFPQAVNYVNAGLELMSANRHQLTINSLIRVLHFCLLWPGLVSLAELCLFRTLCFINKRIPMVETSLSVVGAEVYSIS